MARTTQTGRSVKLAKKLIAARGGLIRTAEALRAGIHPRTLYRMRDEGSLEQLSRGVYRLVRGRRLANPDLVTVAVRVPRGVVCLVSALAFHELTTQVPHAVSLAGANGSERPRLVHPPIEYHRFSGAAFTEGVETHTVDGVAVKVYSPEKTLADCFKFRNKIGLDVFLEALRFCKTRRKWNPTRLLKFAEICRVERVMRPYLEATS